MKLSLSVLNYYAIQKQMSFYLNTLSIQPFVTIFNSRNIFPSIGVESVPRARLEMRFLRSPRAVWINHLSRLVFVRSKTLVPRFVLPLFSVLSKIFFKLPAIRLSSH